MLCFRLSLVSTSHCTELEAIGEPPPSTPVTPSGLFELRRRLAAESHLRAPPYFTLVGSPCADLHTRLQILIGDRLDNVPIVVEHLNVAQTRARTLVRVIERVLPSAFTAIARANAFSLENLPAALFLPSRGCERVGLG